LKVLFLHGLESKPGGSKARCLQNEGYEVLNPMLPRESFEGSIKIAQDLIDAEKPDLVVGSSRGGAVGMCVNTLGAPLILIAPAWERFMNNQHMNEWAIRVEAQKTIILHSENDDVVLPHHSDALCVAHGIKRLNVGLGHRMSDREALEALVDVTKWLTKK